MNLIAAVIFTDDICNDGCSRELHSKRLPRPPASDIEHTMMKAHLSVDLLAWLWQNKTTPEIHVHARWTDIEVDWAFYYV